MASRAENNKQQANDHFSITQASSSET